MEVLLKKDILNYIEKTKFYIDKKNSIHIELSRGFPNGSDELITQVMLRSNLVFKEFLGEAKEVYMIVRDIVDESDYYYSSMRTDDIFKILDFSTFKKLKLENTISFEDEETINYTYDLYEKKIEVDEIPLQKILLGIANCDQGRRPKIFQKIFFVEPKRQSVFYMYDDRGCEIYSTDEVFMGELSNLFRDWLD